MSRQGRGFFGNWFVVFTVVLALGMVLTACGTQGAGDNPQKQGTENGNAQESAQSQGRTGQEKASASNLYEEIKSRGNVSINIANHATDPDFLQGEDNAITIALEAMRKIALMDQEQGR